MLRHLSIKNFALVTEIELDFSAGLTVFCGETGAGKSIIIDALTAAMGERCSADTIQTGAKKFIVEATFDVSMLPAVQTFLDEKELAWDSTELVMRRELSATGTSRCFVNDNPVTASTARELSENLIDFHGQHDTHGLLNVKHHLSLLDTMSADSELLNDMKAHWRNVTRARADLADIEQRAKNADEERERLSRVCKEIGSIAPLPDEFERVNSELKIAESSETVIANAIDVRNALYANDSSAYDQILNACERIKTLAEFDSNLTGIIADLESAATACKEAAAAVAHLTDEDEFSPERIEELRLRQSSLSRLIKKYGSIDEAISILETSTKQLHQLSDLESSIAQAKDELLTAEKEALVIAQKLSKTRKKTANSLSNSILQSLQQMGMPSAQFNVNIAAGPLSSNGTDEVEFHFSANSGESPLPLARIASGGELSRVMLSIKQALAQHGAVGTMVFDEIDTGISGRIARAVGEVMKGLCSRHQILCISHLPQIASLADNMIRVTKTDHGTSTTVEASAVSGNEAVLEIARLLSGSSVTEAALDGARALMDAGNKNLGT